MEKGNAHAIHYYNKLKIVLFSTSITQASKVENKFVSTPSVIKATSNTYPKSLLQFLSNL